MCRARFRSGFRSGFCAKLKLCLGFAAIFLTANALCSPVRKENPASRACGKNPTSPLGDRWFRSTLFPQSLNPLCPSTLHPSIPQSFNPQGRGLPLPYPSPWPGIGHLLPTQLALFWFLASKMSSKCRTDLITWQIWSKIPRATWFWRPKKPRSFKICRKLWKTDFRNLNISEFVFGVFLMFLVSPSVA